MFPPPARNICWVCAGGSSTDIDWSVMSVPGAPPGVSCRPSTGVVGSLPAANEGSALVSMMSLMFRNPAPPLPRAVPASPTGVSLLPNTWLPV